MMQSNLFFLCGPHGSGKTTLAKAMAQDEKSILIPELYSRTIKLNTEPLLRERLKIGSRAIENFEYLSIAKQNSEHIILANRCIYDVQAYQRVYFERGWITQEAFDKSKQYASEFFLYELARPYAVVLNPGFDVVQKHLQKRWSEKGKKWMEEDEEYTRLACISYEHLLGDDHIYYIDHEIDLVAQKEISRAIDWMMEKSDLESKVFIATQ